MRAAEFLCTAVFISTSRDGWVGRRASNWRGGPGPRSPRIRKRWDRRFLSQLMGDRIGSNRNHYRASKSERHAYPGKPSSPPQPAYLGGGIVEGRNPCGRACAPGTCDVQNCKIRPTLLPAQSRFAGIRAGRRIERDISPLCESHTDR